MTPNNAGSLTLDPGITDEGFQPARLPGRPIHVLVVDGHPVVHLGLHRLVQRNARIRIVEGAQTAAAGVDIARRLRPELVLLDPRLPDMLIDDAVARLRAVSPGSKIIVFAAEVTPTVREDVTRLGVSGLLGKDSDPEHFLDVIVRVSAGQVCSVASGASLQQGAVKLRGTPLTLREHEILRRAAHGESNAEIARAIHLAPTTVKSYLQNALRKLDARNRAEAVFKLSELGLL